MKICLLTHTFPRFKGDSAAPFMGVLAKALVELGNEVFVLTPFDPKFKTQDTPYHIQTYKYIWPEKLHILGYSRTLKNGQDLRLPTFLLGPLLVFFGFLALIKLIINNKIDIISVHWIIPNGFIAYLVSNILGTPFTVTIPGSDVYVAGKNFIFKNLTYFAAKSAKIVIADSQHYLDQLEDLGIYPKEKVVLRYGVDTNIFKPTKKDRSLVKKLSIKDDAFIILAVGRLVSKKGFAYLIEAMPKVLLKIPNAKLIIVGDGDQKNELLTRVEKLSIKKNCVFAGTIAYERLVKYYNLADVFVMPSIKDESGNIDASPVAMMEAMCCGTPVVATKFAGSNQVITDKNGLMVQEKNSNELANAIVEILLKKDQSFIRKVVQEQAKENFSSSAIAEKYINVFNHAINS